MKKFVISLFKFIFMLFISAIILIYIFSVRSNISFEDAISYFKNIGYELLGLNNTGNVITNTNPNITQPIEYNSYYYEQLDNDAKIIYTALVENIDNLKEENYTIDFSTKFNGLLNTSTGQYKLRKSFQSALAAFFYDHPELFYIDYAKISLNTVCISLGAKKHILLIYHLKVIII